MWDNHGASHFPSLSDAFRPISPVRASDSAAPVPAAPSSPPWQGAALKPLAASITTGVLLCLVPASASVSRNAWQLHLCRHHCGHHHPAPAPRRRRSHGPRCLHPHQNPSFLRCLLDFQRPHLLAHRPRLLLRPKIHEDQPRQPLHYPIQTSSRYSRHGAVEPPFVIDRREDEVRRAAVSQAGDRGNPDLVAGRETIRPRQNRPRRNPGGGVGALGRVGGRAGPGGGALKTEAASRRGGRGGADPRGRRSVSGSRWRSWTRMRGGSARSCAVCCSTFENVTTALGLEKTMRDIRDKRGEFRMP